MGRGRFPGAADGYTVLDGDGNVVTDASVTRQLPFEIVTPEPGTWALMFIGLGNAGDVFSAKQEGLTGSFPERLLWKHSALRSVHKERKGRFMAETATDVIKRYLVDAIAAEKSFETQLTTFSKEGDDTQAQSLFAQHAKETKNQYERLTARLEALGGSTSTAKTILAHLFSNAPKAASLGHEKEERTTQNLMIAYAVENSECAMYESLITAAQAAGDSQTESLAREIQNEERQTAEKVWKQIAPAARDAFRRVTSGAASTARA